MSISPSSMLGNLEQPGASAVNAQAEGSDNVRLQSVVGSQVEESDASQAYQIQLVPLNYPFNLAHFPNPEKTILLKKDKNGVPKAHLIEQGKMSEHSFDIGLSSCELSVLEFPAVGDNPVAIQRNQFPELIDKVSLRCGLTSSLFSQINVLLFSVGCGASTVAALFLFMGASPAFFMLAPVVGLSSIVANYRMSIFDLAEFFQGGLRYLFNNKKRNVDNITHEISYASEPISLSRIFLLSLGIVSSIAFGFTTAILTFTSVLELATALGVATTIFASAVMPIAIILAAATFVCMTILMAKAIADSVKSKTIGETIQKSLENVFNIDPIIDTGWNYVKRLGVFLVVPVFSCAAILLTFYGAYSSQKASVDSVVAIFKITGQAAKSFALYVLGGLALLSQIPFILKTTLNPIFQRTFRWPEKQMNTDENVANKSLHAESLQSQVFSFMKSELASFINAVANAIIPLRGTGTQVFHNVYLMLGTLGAFAVSFLSTFGNRVSQDIPGLAPAVNHAPVNDAVIAETTVSRCSTASILCQVNPNQLRSSESLDNEQSSVVDDDNHFVEEHPPVTTLQSSEQDEQATVGDQFINKISCRA